MLRSIKDVVDAVDAGRVHTQRFFKNANAVAGDNTWTDWAFASGQPAYDARIGDAATFTPAVASRNDAIWFPDMAAGMERRLLEANIYISPTGTGQARVECQIYDLIGYYPLLDGDSTDLQEMDNTLPLPRYATGAGVRAVLVNQVAPAVAAAQMTVSYTNSDGVSGRTVDWFTTTYGVTKAAYTTANAGASGPLFCKLAEGDTGIRQIDSVQFITPPGGLFAIYLVKPLVAIENRHNSAASGQSVNTERNFAMTNGFNMPAVADGAHLGLFMMTSGSARTVSLFGNLTFVWG
jgi:hypothetical protein